MNKWFVVLFLLPLCGCGPSSKENYIPSITVCDLYANPEKYHNQEIGVSGRIIVEFEYQSLVCLDEETQKQSLLWGIWITADLDSIQKRSPKFYRQIKEGYDLAHTWKGGLRGNIRCLGHFKLSDSFLKDASENKNKAGGLFGVFGGEFTIKEILDCDPEIVKKPDLPVSVNKACLFFGIPPCDQTDLEFSAIYKHVEKIFPKKTKKQDVMDVIGKLREKYEQTGNKVVVENTATRILVGFPVQDADIIDEYVMRFIFTTEGELSGIRHINLGYNAHNSRPYMGSDEK